MNAAEEQYVHFVESIDNLYLALKILTDLQKVEKHTIITAAAFRSALVEYAKPYTRSDGFLGKYKLDDRFIPRDALDLHKRIITLRNQVLAHDDLTPKEAMLHIERRGDNQIISIVSNVTDVLAELKAEAVRSLITRTLDEMYKARPNMEKALGAAA